MSKSRKTEIIPTFVLCRFYPLTKTKSDIQLTRQFKPWLACTYLYMTVWASYAPGKPYGTRTSSIPPTPVRAEHVHAFEYLSGHGICPAQSYVTAFCVLASSLFISRSNRGTGLQGQLGIGWWLRMLMCWSVCFHPPSLSLSLSVTALSLSLTSVNL